MIKEVAISQVTEGDWIAKEVQVKGKYVCGPKDLGIEKEQLKKLQTLAKQNKIKTIWVKYGIPFVPSFLFGYILTVSIQYEIWKYF